MARISIGVNEFELPVYGAVDDFDAETVANLMLAAANEEVEAIPVPAEVEQDFDLESQYDDLSDPFGNLD